MSNLAPLPEGATVARYIEKRWGMRTRLVPLATFAVLSTVSRAVKGNPKRMALTITNVGTGVVTVGFDSSVTAGNGIPLAPSGGTLSLNVDEDGELVTYDVFAIAPAGGNNLLAWEVETL
jgi:hypothetical protein